MLTRGRERCVCRNCRAVKAGLSVPLLPLPLPPMASSAGCSSPRPFLALARVLLRLILVFIKRALAQAPAGGQQVGMAGRSVGEGGLGWQVRWGCCAAAGGSPTPLRGRRWLSSTPLVHAQQEAGLA